MIANTEAASSPSKKKKRDSQFKKNSKALKTEQKVKVQ